MARGTDWRPWPSDQFGLGVSGAVDGAGGLAGASCCMPGMLRITGISCMPPGCPGRGCIMAMFRQQGHMAPVDWPGCAGWVIWPGCWAWAVAVGAPHIIGLAAAVDPVVWAAAWCIGQARTGVAANPAAKAMARVTFLMVRSSGIVLGEIYAVRGVRQLPMW